MGNHWQLISVEYEFLFHYDYKAYDYESGNTVVIMNAIIPFSPQSAIAVKNSTS